MIPLLWRLGHTRRQCNLTAAFSVGCAGEIREGGFAYSWAFPPSTSAPLCGAFFLARPSADALTRAAIGRQDYAPTARLRYHGPQGRSERRPKPRRGGSHGEDQRRGCGDRAACCTRAGPGAGRLPRRLRQGDRGRQQGRPGRGLRHHRRRRLQSAAEGFRDPLSEGQDRLHRPEFDRALQPLHRRGGLGFRHRRPAVVLGHGPAGQARRRRQRRSSMRRPRSPRCPNGRSGRTRPTAPPTSRSPSSTTSAWCRQPTCRPIIPRCSIC